MTEARAGQLVETRARCPKAKFGVFLTLSIALAACGSGGPDREAASPTPSPSPTASPDSSEPVRIEVGEGPITIAAGFGSIWVEYHRENRVGRIDPATNEATALDAPVHCSLTTGAGTVWATEASSSSLTRVDPETGDVQATIQIPDVCGITIEGDEVWAVSPGLGEVWRIDPATNRVVDKVDVGELIFGGTIHGDRLWVTGEEGGGKLWVVDTRTAEIEVEKRLEGAEGVLFAYGSAWIFSRLANTVYRLDPDTAEVLGTTDVLAPAGIAAADGTIWVTGFGSRLVTRIDPEGNVVAEGQVPAINLGNPVFAFGSLWVADLTANVVLRLDPAEVAPVP